MWEFMVRNVYTLEVGYIYGYNLEDACYRNDLDIEDVIVIDEVFMEDMSEEDIYDEMIDPEFI